MRTCYTGSVRVPPAHGPLLGRFRWPTSGFKTQFFFFFLFSSRVPVKHFLPFCSNGTNFNFCSMKPLFLQRNKLFRLWALVGSAHSIWPLELLWAGPSVTPMRPCQIAFVCSRDRRPKPTSRSREFFYFNLF